MSRSSPDPVYVLIGSTSPVSYLKFTGLNNLLSGNYDGNIYTWSMETKRITHKLSAHEEASVLYIGLIDNNRMVSQGRNGTIKIWSVTESNWVETGAVKCLEMGFCRSCLLDDKTLVAPSDNQSEAIIYDINSQEVVATLSPDNKISKQGMCMNISSGNTDKNGRSILIGYEDGSVALWDVRNKKMVDRVKVHEDSLMCLDYCEDLSCGFSGSVNEIIKSWKIDNDKLEAINTASVTNSGLSDVLVRPDGKIVVFGCWDGNVRVFGAKKLKPLAVLNYHKESIHCLAFSESNLLACGSKDHQISLWDIYK